MGEAKRRKQLNPDTYGKRADLSEIAQQVYDYAIHQNSIGVLYINFIKKHRRLAGIDLKYISTDEMKKLTETNSFFSVKQDIITAEDIDNFVERCDLSKSRLILMKNIGFIGIIGIDSILDTMEKSLKSYVK